MSNQKASNDNAVTERRSKTRRFSINENRDILVEVLKRLDGRTLGVAACVCRLWCHLATLDDSIWEHVCFRPVSPPGVRTLVVALGGYKRLYMLCVGPVLGRVGPVWSKQGAQLLLSLFCVDYYEKLGAVASGTDTNSSNTASSLLFL
ncbi:F-box protein SNE isoform X2 [Silene latifolia]